MKDAGFGVSPVMFNGGSIHSRLHPLWYTSFVDIVSC
jgi:hypothetical protein